MSQNPRGCPRPILQTRDSMIRVPILKERAALSWVRTVAIRNQVLQKGNKLLDWAEVDLKKDLSRVLHIDNQVRSRLLFQGWGHRCRFLN